MKKELFQKLKSIERDVSDERGAFEFFGLFLREDAPDKWDMVVAAPWIEEKDEALRYLSKKVAEVLEPDELLALSRIVLMDHGAAALEAMLRSVKVVHGSVEIHDCDFFGLAVKHAFVVTSNRLSEPPAEKAG